MESQFELKPLNVEETSYINNVMGFFILFILVILVFLIPMKINKVLSSKTGENTFEFTLRIFLVFIVWYLCTCAASLVIVKIFKEHQHPHKIAKAFKNALFDPIFHYIT